MKPEHDHHTPPGRRTTRRRWRWVAYLALITSLPPAAGCYGRFPLTHAVYEFNGEITDNKVVHNIFFWIFVWLPVYWIAELGDAIIFNLIEFWTGSSLDLSSTVKQGENTVSLKSSEDGNELILTVSGKNGEKLGETRFIRIEDGKYEVRDAGNNLEGTVLQGPNGELIFSNAEGEIFQTLDTNLLAGNSQF